MQFLIVCATPWELKTVKTQIKSLNFKKSFKITYLCTGMGNYETIYNLTKYFTENQETLDDYIVINIWICWYRGEKEKNIQVWRIKNINTKKELIVPISSEFSKISSIYSSETPVLQPLENEKSWYVDMESWAIEYCCDKFRVPRIILKVPYDRIWEETKSFNKDDACKLLSENIDCWKLIEKLL